MILGPEVTDQSALTCTRQMHGHELLCGRPATHHVMWDANAENSLSCPDHAIEAHGFGAVQIHSVQDGACGMPGSIWVEPEARCVMDVLEVEPTLNAYAGSYA